MYQHDLHPGLSHGPPLHTPSSAPHYSESPPKPPNAACATAIRWWLNRTRPAPRQTSPRDPCRRGQRAPPRAPRRTQTHTTIAAPLARRLSRLFCRRLARGRLPGALRDRPTLTARLHPRRPTRHPLATASIAPSSGGGGARAASPVCNARALLCRRWRHAAGIGAGRQSRQAPAVHAKRNAATAHGGVAGGLADRAHNLFGIPELHW
eukprot:229897-Chlamydomonas_euryale.AAC.19